MYEVAFQDYQAPPPQNFESGGTVPDDPPPDPTTLTELVQDVQTILAGTGGTISNDELALLTPDEWESFLTDLLGFVDSGPQGSDQNSYYDDHENTSPLGALLVHDFGWMLGVRELPGYGYYDYLTQDIDPEFLEMEFAAHLGTSMLTSSGSSMSSLADIPFGLTMNGHSFSITWHSGTAPGANYSHLASDPDAIVVTAQLGYWTVRADPDGPASGTETAPHGIDLMQLGATNNPYLPYLDQALHYLSQDPLALQVMIDAWHHGIKVTIVTGGARTQFIESTNTVEWNPGLGLRLANGGIMSPAMCLIHEMAHILVNLVGFDSQYGNLEDRYIIEHYEQIIGQHLGEPTREDHYGDFVFVPSVIYHEPPTH